MAPRTSRPACPRVISASSPFCCLLRRETATPHLSTRCIFGATSTTKYHGTPRTDGAPFARPSCQTRPRRLMASPDQDLDRPVTRSDWLRSDPLAKPPVELHRIGRHLAAAPTMDSAPSRRPGARSFLSAPSSFTSTDQCRLLSASPLPLRRVCWHEIQGALTPGPGARPSKHPGVTTTPRRPQAMNRWKDPAMRGGELLGRGDRLLAPRRMPVRTTISEPPDFLTVEEAAAGCCVSAGRPCTRRPAGGATPMAKRAFRSFLSVGCCVCRSPPSSE